MKSIIGLGFALSVLGATSAIAAPHATSPVVAATNVSQPATLNVNTVGVDHKDSQASTLYVAENRPEFGSKYQRY
jgi:energy-converting hydrogenase Eha subunit E